MSNKNSGLSDKLKSLGFAQEKQMKLYGVELELVSDPIFAEEDDGVFVEAIEKKSRQPRRIRIPLNIVQMATERPAA
jgi:hypothetical protein